MLRKFFSSAVFAFLVFLTIGWTPIFNNHVLDVDKYVITDAASITALKGYTEITGHLIIENTQLVDLSGLEDLIIIGGELRIKDNANLTGLNGLNNLERSGSVDISYNPLIVNFNGLGSLRIVDNDLDVWSNNSLSSLEGLNTLNYARDITLWDNPVLGSLELLRDVTIEKSFMLYGANLIDNIRFLTGKNIPSVYICNLPLLTSLEGLDGLIDVDTLAIKDCPLLSSLAGLDNLSSYKEDLIITNNDQLENLNELSNVRPNSIVRCGFFHGVFLCNRIYPSLTIQGNDKITNLVGLEKIDGAFYLTISDNTSLTTLNGLNNISVIRQLIIENNSMLHDLSVFNSISSLGNIDIADNDSLVEIPVMENVNDLGSCAISGNPKLISFKSNAKEISYFTISNNVALTDLVLNNLEEVFNFYVYDNENLSTCQFRELLEIDFFNIYRNDSLTNLAFDNLQTVLNFYIYDNETLSTCKVQELLDQVTVNNLYKISGNGPCQ